MSDHRILINRAADRFSVTVDPVPEGDSFAKVFDTHREAYGYAGGLRMVKGWRPIVDLTPGILNRLLGQEGGAA